MLTVEDDWVQYEPVPVLKVAVRGGASCHQRVPVVRERVPALVPAQIVRPAGPPAGARSTRSATRPLRLTRRGRIVLALLPGLLALGGAAALVGAGTTEAAASAPSSVVVGR